MKTPGLVCTFYSFKGGVGRSMALANTAALLAKWGNKVLVLDWDIEAPGIERYFLNSPSRLINSRRETNGIVDLVLAYTQNQSLDWHDCLVKAIPFGDKSKVDIITAGKETADYNGRVQQIAWVDLFSHKEFGTYLEQLRQQWKSEYDFVLVDSRTGITDIGGICTIHLPDILVLFFSANWQSVQGVLDVMQTAQAKHQNLPYDRQQLIGIPVPSRFENVTEYERASEWKKVFADSFEDVYRAWIHKDSKVKDVTDRLLIPNIPYWSFSEPSRELGEPLPVAQEGTSDIRSLGHAYEVLAKLLHYRLSESEPIIPVGGGDNDIRFQSNWPVSRMLKLCRNLVLGGMVALILLIAYGWGYPIYQDHSARTFFLAAGYPAELVDWEHQLKGVGVNEPLNLKGFTLCSSDSIEELSIKAAASSNSIAGLSSLSRCDSLKKLALDLTDSQVSNLDSLAQLSNLAQLTLDLSDRQVSNLDSAAQLSNRTQLPLDLGNSQVSNLDPLAKLSNRTQLMLDLNASQVSNLEPLMKLSNLAQLTLSLSNSQVSNLQPLTKLSNLNQLTLSLSNSRVSDLVPLARLSNLTQLTLDLNASQVSNLEPLAQLSNRTQLTLDLSDSQVSDLDSLAKLSNRTQLMLNLNASQVSNLAWLPKLSNLRQLTLDLQATQVSKLEPLAELRSLRQLTLNLSNSKVSDLGPLEQLSNLTELTLDLNASQVKNLEPLAKLKNLTQLRLDLSNSQVSDLKPLAQLSNLTQLTLDLNASQVSNLEPLAQLSNLTQLTLDLRDSHVSNSVPLANLGNLTQLTLFLSSIRDNNLEPLTKQSNLTQLTLYLSGRQVTNLEPLAQLSNLTQLTLDLGGSQVSNLEPLTKLTRLQKLSLENATRAQRQSLRVIPASLEELKF